MHLYLRRVTGTTPLCSYHVGGFDGAASLQDCSRGDSPGLLPFMFLVPGESCRDCSSEDGSSDNPHICFTAGTLTVYLMFWVYSRSPSSKVSLVWESVICSFGVGYIEGSAFGVL